MMFLLVRPDIEFRNFPCSCEKIGLVLFHVIPEKAGIQCFHRATNTLDPGFHRGDEYSAIFSHLPF
jgi:hypothetical protein